MADRIFWLVLVYRVPGEPSRLRAAVRRRVKAAGAVYLANSVVALPASPAAERSLRSLRREVGEMGGSAQLLRAEAVAGERDVMSMFNTVRNDEYMDVIARCGDLLAKIESETAAGHFTYGELGESSGDLAKLALRLENVRAEDAFGASQAESASSALAKCREALDRLAERVFRAGESPEGHDEQF